MLPFVVNPASSSSASEKMVCSPAKGLIVANCCNDSCLDSSALHNVLVVSLILLSDTLTNLFAFWLLFLSRPTNGAGSFAC